MALSGLSPKQGHLERLLELAAGIGFDNKPADPQEEALIHTLLSLCTRKYTSDARSNAIAALGGGDITIALLNLCSSTSGVPQALSLHALKTWSEDTEECLQKCIRAGAIPLLLSVFASSLPTSISDIAAAYSASLAVILLRGMLREGVDEGAEALLQANGVEILLDLLKQMALDDRSLCLVLYLLNDATRRSPEVLDRAIEANAVHQVVAVLRKPISEATKFAALILNRWSLAAQHLPAIRAAGSVEMLLQVLEVACAAADHDTTTVDAETIAYALSAFAIMTQDAIEAVRTRLLNSSTSLVAISRAVALYERCFKGIGFPHAMLCMLLEGPNSAPLVAALAAHGLLPLWLSARHVGVQLAERAALPDALAAMEAVYDPDEALEVTVALTHLLQRSPVPQFMKAMANPQRMERLTRGALTEVMAAAAGETLATAVSSSSIGQCAPSDPSPCEEFAPISPSESSAALEEWTASALDATTSAGTVQDDDMTHQQRTPAHRRQSSTASDTCTVTLNVPRPPVTISLTPSGPITAPSPVKGGKAVGGCAAALARLVSLTTNSDAPTPMDTGAHPSPKRQRALGPAASSSSSPAFRKEDVGVARYDTLCFVVGGREVHAVGFVLEARSSFLRGLLSTIGHVGERVFVPQLEAFTPEAMHCLFLKAVEWCYTGEVEGLSTFHDSAFNLWALAEFLQIDGLQRYCENVVESWFFARPEVILHSLKLAEAYASAEPLRKRVARHVLSLLIDLERSSEAETLVSAMTAAGHAAALGMAIAGELLHEMRALETAAY